MGEGKEKSQAVTLSMLPVIPALSTVFARDPVSLPAGRSGFRFSIPFFRAMSLSGNGKIKSRDGSCGEDTDFSFSFPNCNVWFPLQ